LTLSSSYSVVEAICVFLMCLFN